MKHFIRIDKDRTIIVHNINFEDKKIEYRNIGESFDIHIPETRNFMQQNDKIIVLTAEGEVNFFFPKIWLMPYDGMIRNLIEKGMININE